MTDFVIETRNLSKRYGRKLALNRLDLQVPRGRIHAVVVNGRLMERAQLDATLAIVRKQFQAPASGR